MIVLELFSVYMTKRHSVTFARVSRQYAEAVKVLPAAPGEPTSVLMVGNSLLLYGIDVDRLQELTARSLRIYPIFLEGTSYYDWLYGLRHLFRQGARPQVVVLGLEAKSSLTNGVWDESPRMLFDARDVLGVASDLGLDHTATSNLLLSHMSAFWGMRSIYRRWIFRRLVPHYQDLLTFIQSGLYVPQGLEFEPIVMARLQTLRDLCEAHGAKLILVIPPTLSSESTVRRMAIASQKIGVKALVPIDPMALAPRFYQTDAIHLNSDGAVRFTSALAVHLSKTIYGSNNSSFMIQ
jgi:hypothetical protein